MKPIMLLVGAALLLVAGAAPGAAHSDLEDTFPKIDSSVQGPLDHIMLNFTEAPTEDTSIQVLDGCGDDVVEETYITGRTLHVLLEPGPHGNGKWEVAFRVISAEDGHKINGDYSFKVKGKTDCSAPDPGADDEGEPADPVGNDDEGDDDTEGPSGSDEQAAPGPNTSDEGASLPILPLVIGGIALVGIAALVRMRSST